LQHVIIKTTTGNHKQEHLTVCTSV